MKNSKGGEIQISPVFEKTFEKFSYDALSNDLVFVFNKFKEHKRTVKSKELVFDLENSMKAIQEIENGLREGHYSQKQRTFNQDSIDTLKTILFKTPFHISIGFEEYTESQRIQDVATDFKEKVIKASKKVKSLHEKKRLSDLRFFPSVKWNNSNIVDDDLIRQRLALGIFDYLQRLIIKRCLRPKCCVFCGKWFFATKTNALTCSSYCRDRKFATSHKGSERRRINTRNSRKRASGEAVAVK